MVLGSTPNNIGLPITGIKKETLKVLLSTLFFIDFLIHLSIARLILNFLAHFFAKLETILE